jgi:hypothetical protein
MGDRLSDQESATALAQQRTNAIMNRQTFRVTSLSDRHSFIRLSDRIALITRTLKRKGKNGKTAAIVAGYFGFNSQQEAQTFIRSLCGYFPKAFCQLRKAERLTTAFEVKVRSFSALERFAWTVATQPAIVTPQQAKADIYPAPIEEVRPVTPIRAIAPAAARFLNHSSAPSVIGRSKPKTVRGLSIE